ncbi:MAG: CDP-alcohol phosphatidyltransferase family protein [Rhodanobacteraceae bacterium]
MLRNLPNLITVLRMLLVVPLCWLIANERYEGALAIAAIAGLSDAVDGFLAKRYDWQTWLGGILDPIADKLLLIATFLSLAFSADLPMWLVALTIGRDLAIVAGATAYYYLIGHFDAEPSRLSKLTTLVQILFVLGELLRLSRLIDVPDPVRNASIAITAALTVASGVHYVVVWGSRALRASAEKRRRA